MRFTSAAPVTLIGLLASVPSALATITITGPSANSYWVQNVSNLITWEFTSGDPNPITITVTNENATFLNGAFPIAEGVDLSNKSFTVTNVTLNVHAGYVVNFVSPKNLTQVLASSAPFEVRAPGTPQASQATPVGSSPSATGTSPAGNGTASGANSTATKATSASPRTLDGTLGTLVPPLAMSVLMSMAGVLATL